MRSARRCRHELPLRRRVEVAGARHLSLAGRRARDRGARGLGKAIAHRLAEAGAAVAIADIDDALARARHPTSHAHAAKRRRRANGRDGCRRVRSGEDGLGSRGIDIWINNAGVFPSIPVLDTEDAHGRASSP